MGNLKASKMKCCQLKPEEGAPECLNMQVAALTYNGKIRSSGNLRVMLCSRGNMGV